MRFNKVILGGHLTRDPERRSTTGGKSVVSFGLAVNGWKEDEVMFVDCTAWEKAGEAIADHLGKGDPILIEGRLDQRRWDDKEGNKRSKHEVTVERFSFAGKPNAKSKASRDGETGDGQPDDGEIPF